MRPRHKALQRLIEHAVLLRIAGLSWKRIGRHLDRHPDHVRRWPDRYSLAWEEAFEELERIIRERDQPAITKLLRVLAEASLTEPIRRPCLIELAAAANCSREVDHDCVPAAAEIDEDCIPGTDRRREE